MKRTTLIFFAAALLPLAPARAEEAVSLKLTPPPGKIRMAEVFKVEVAASFPEKYSIKPDTAGADSPDFEIAAFIKRGSSAAGGIKTDTFEIDARAFALGQSTFPALSWGLYGPDGSAAGEAKTQPFVLDIGPVFEKTDGDIRDIYPPFRYLPWLWIFAGLAAAAAGIYLYRRYRHGPAAAAYALWKDARTPYQRARERLEKLSVSPLAAAGKMKEYYIGLTSVLRFYLGEEFAIDAELMTTSDLTRELKKTGAELKTTLRAREFLHKADLVKFAKLKPEDAAADTRDLEGMLGEFSRTAENARAAAAAEAAAKKTAAKTGGKL